MTSYSSLTALKIHPETSTSSIISTSLKETLEARPIQNWSTHLFLLTLAVTSTLLDSHLFGTLSLLWTSPYQPTLSKTHIEPLKFWMERKDSPLYNLALQLQSVPCSSASVEWLFSKAGIVSSQQRTRLQCSRIEQLLFYSNFHFSFSFRLNAVFVFLSTNT